jgi:hypothetical protein
LARRGNFGEPAGVEDICLDDFPPEAQAEIRATIERARAACQWLAAEAEAAAPEEERYRQASERLQRYLDIEAGRVPSPVQIQLFKRLDAALEAIKSSSAPSPWLKEVLDTLLEATKSSQPSLQRRKRKRRQKKKSAPGPKPRGKPQDFNHELIRSVVDDYLKKHPLPCTRPGLRPSLHALMAKAKDICRGKVELPRRTQLQKILAPVFRAYQKMAANSKVAANSSAI